MLSNIITAANYDGNDSTETAYPVPFEYRDADHVFVDVAANGSGTVTIDDDGVAVFSAAQDEMQAGHKLWIYGDLLTVVSRADSTHFVLTAGFPGSSVPFVNVSLPETLQANEFTLSADGVRTTVAVPSTSRVSIYRRTPSVMETAIPETGKFPAAAVESALDFLTLRVQEIQSQVDGTGVSIPAGYAGNVLQDSAVFTDAADRSLSVPKRAGQLGVQLDNGMLYRATATSAGAWSPPIVTVDDVPAIAPASGTMVPGVRYLSYGVCDLTVPATALPGQWGSLELGSYGTAKFSFPSGAEVIYEGLPAGWFGRPAVHGIGGVIRWELIGPGKYLVSGQYAKTPSAWHPIDAGSSLIGVWQAGYGRNWSAISGTSESVAGPADSDIVWENLFAPVDDRRFSYNWPSGDADSFAPTYARDTAFGVGAQSISGGLTFRTGSSTNRYAECNGVPVSGPSRIYFAIRQHATGQNGTSLVRMSSVNAPGGFGGFQGGIVWAGNTYGYQFVHATSITSWGAKSGVMATHEDTTSRVLISCAINSTGGAVFHSGHTQISGAAPSTGNAVLPVTKMELYTGLNCAIGLFACINGAASDATAERDFFLQMI